mgnify:CR=1 FL=1
MEIKKSQFDQRPSLVELEGAVIRINFDIEETTVVVNDDAEEPESRVAYLAYVVRVEHPLTLEAIKEAVMAKGFDEYKSEEVAASALLHLAQNGQPVGEPIELAKQMMTARINAYDKSTAVNQFTYAGQPMWLSRELRRDLADRIERELSLGNEALPLNYEGQTINLPLEDAKAMVAVLAHYADLCFDKTEEHKAAILALEDVEDILDYDYTQGYPAKPSFPVE